MDRPTDVLGVIERAYALDTSPEQWLRDLAESVYAHFGQDLGMTAYYYRVTESGRLEVGHDLSFGMRQPHPMPLAESLGALPSEFVRKSFVRCECTTQSEAMDPEMRAQLEPMMEAAASVLGWRDIAMVGGMDPTGEGVALSAWLPNVTRFDAQTRAIWTRVAVHVVAGNRLRRTLAASRGASASDVTVAADAVLRPDGRVEHAEPGAQPREARDALKRAVRQVEKARGALRREDPTCAVESWQGLVSCRWSLVDHFESDGKRYIVARRNDPQLGGLDALTARERQAVGYAALRHSNKLIAYELGVSASTVGVLLHRAAKKLGAHTREALVELYTARSRPTH